MSLFSSEAKLPDMQCFKDVIRTKDILLFRKVTFFPDKAMSPDMQYFKDVVRTRDKLLYRKVTRVLLPWRSHVAGRAVFQGCGTYHR
jgi:hypothetical protein